MTRPTSPIEHNTSRPIKKTRFNRDTLAHLEKTFPTDTERDGDEPLSCQISSPGKDLQHPLLFLAECARRGWDSDTKKTEPLVIPLPTTTLPWEDQRLLDQWQMSDIQAMVRDQKTFFQHGLYGSKRDVSAGLDAVQRGLITEEQVEELFGWSACSCIKRRVLADRPATFALSILAFPCLMKRSIQLNGCGLDPPTSSPQSSPLARQRLRLCLVPPRSKRIGPLDSTPMSTSFSLSCVPRLPNQSRSSRLKSCVIIRLQCEDPLIR